MWRTTSDVPFEVIHGWSGSPPTNVTMRAVKQTPRLLHPSTMFPNQAKPSRQAILRLILVPTISSCWRTLRIARVPT